MQGRYATEFAIISRLQVDFNFNVLVMFALIGGGMKQRTLDRLIAAADHSGLSLDVLVALARGFDDSEIIKLCGNCASMPRYMKSKVTPNLLQSTSASSGNIRR